MREDDGGERELRREKKTAEKSAMITHELHTREDDGALGAQALHAAIEASLQDGSLPALPPGGCVDDDSQRSLCV